MTKRHLTQFFTLDEMIASDTAERLDIDNVPSPKIIDALEETAGHMEVVRNLLKSYPIKINSGFRCAALNLAIGGAPNSDHIAGRAVDFTCPAFGSPAEICKFLRDRVFYSKMIYEYTWVHMSFVKEHITDKIVLTKRRGSTGYLPGIALA